MNNEGERFLGSIVGRYANRISKGRFMIDSVQYQLPLNNNGQTLHGGLKGLDMRVWNVDRISDKSIDFHTFHRIMRKDFLVRLILRFVTL